MSTDVSITLNFNKKIRPSSFVQALADTGWGCDLDGTVGILSFPDDNASDWECIPCKDLSKLRSRATSWDDIDSGFGLAVVHVHTGIGGPMTTGKERNSLYWGVSVNIPHINGGRMLIDVSKCLAAIWPALQLAELMVLSIDMRIE